MILRYLFAILEVLLFLMCENAQASYRYPYLYLGSDQCLGSDKISHKPGEHWIVQDPHWTVSKENMSSSIERLSADTPVKRIVAPYHASFSNLADVTCDYSAGRLILTRTYRGGESPFPEANQIYADAHTREGRHSSWPYSSTICLTTINTLSVCNWDFVLYNIDPSFHSG